MGKHAKQQLITSRNAVTGENHDLAYWHRSLMTARREGLALHEEMAYEQIDKLLDAILASR